MRCHHVMLRRSPHVPCGALQDYFVKGDYLGHVEIPLSTFTAKHDAAYAAAERRADKLMAGGMTAREVLEMALSEDTNTERGPSHDYWEHLKRDPLAFVRTCHGHGLRRTFTGGQRDGCAGRQLAHRWRYRAAAHSCVVRVFGRSYHTTATASGAVSILLGVSPCVPWCDKTTAASAAQTQEQSVRTPSEATAHGCVCSQVAGRGRVGNCT